MFSLMSLAELTEIITRGISPRYAESGITVLNQKCVRGNRVDYSFSRRTHESQTRIRADRFVRLGDVLVNSTGTGTLGRVAQVRELLEPVTVDSHISIVRPDHNKVDLRYFGYAMIYRQPYIETLGEGATNQTELSRTRLSQVTIPVPLSTKVQRNIAAILSVYDDLIENNTRRIRILEQIARDLYQEWFVHFRFPGHESVEIVDSSTEYRMIPNGWTRGTLHSLCSYINRGISPKYDDSAECIVINQKCIRNGRLDLEKARRNAKPVPQDKYVQLGDILVNSTGEGTLGRVAQVYFDPTNCTVDSHVSIVRPSDKIYTDYLGMALIEVQEYLASLGEGATNQTELTRARLSNIEITIPTSDIAAQFSDVVSPLRSLVIRLMNKNIVLGRTRDFLLPRLISGEIDVQNHEVES